MQSNRNHNTPARWFGLVLFCLLGWGVAAADRGGRSADKPTDYDVKVNYLRNFPSFVDWPPDTYTNANCPFVIGVIGEDPFGAALEQTFAGVKVNGRAVLLRRYPAGALQFDCQLLFIGRSEKARQGAILATLQGRPILTVGESEGFLEAGGMIRFVIAKENVRFEINTRPAERSGLKISGKLQGVALRVVSFQPRE